jgi:TnpA family transposase
LARALSEIGRIAKTVHILHYVDDPATRRSAGAS